MSRKEPLKLVDMKSNVPQTPFEKMLEQVVKREVKSHQTDFYDYDLEFLRAAKSGDSFVWQVRPYGTYLSIKENIQTVESAELYFCVASTWPDALYLYGTVHSTDGFFRIDREQFCKYVYQFFWDNLQENRHNFKIAENEWLKRGEKELPKYKDFNLTFNLFYDSPSYEDFKRACFEYDHSAKFKLKEFYQEGSK